MKVSFPSSVYKDFERRQRLVPLPIASDFETLVDAIILSCWEPPATLEPIFLDQTRGNSVSTSLKVCAIAQRHNWAEARWILRQRLRQRQPQDDCVRAFLIERKRDMLHFAQSLPPLSDDANSLSTLFVREHVAESLAAEEEFEAAAQVLSPLLAWRGPKSELVAVLRYRAIQYLYLSGTFKTSEILSLLLDEDTIYSTKRFLLAGRSRQLFALYLAYCLDDATLIRDRLQNFRSSLLHRKLPDANVFEIVAHQLRSHGYRSLRARMWRLVGASEAPSQTERIFQKRLFPDLFWFLKAQQKIATLERLQDVSDLPTLRKFIQNERAQKSAAWHRRALAQSLIVHLGSNSSAFLELWPQYRDELSLGSSYEARTAFSILEAAFHYRKGDFQSCISSIQRAHQSSLPPIQRLVLEQWLSVAQGQAHHSKQPAVIVRANRLGKLLFAPKLVAMVDGRYQVSDHYEVDLSELRVLHRLLQALLHAKNFQLDVNAVQLVVWRQTTNLQGWKQKIRNSISRLRSEFRWTLNPLFVQSDGIVLLNAAGVHISAPPQSLYLERRAELLRILSRESSATQSLVQASKIPLATVKRILRQLVDEGLIERWTSGNRPHYRLLSEGPTASK